MDASHQEHAPLTEMLGRHRDELSETVRTRADQLAQSITSQLDALGITNIDEFASKVDSGSISQDKALPILSQMEDLKHLIDFGDLGRIDWDKVDKKREFESASDITSMGVTSEGNIVYTSKDKWIVVKDGKTGEKLFDADLDEISSKDLAIIGVTRDNEVLLQHVPSDGSKVVNNYGEVFIWDFKGDDHFVAIDRSFNKGRKVIFDTNTQTLFAHNSDEQMIHRFHVPSFYTEDIDLGSIPEDRMLVGRLSSGEYVFMHEDAAKQHFLSSWDEKNKLQPFADGSAYSNPSLILQDGSILIRKVSWVPSLHREVVWLDNSTGANKIIHDDTNTAGMKPERALRLPNNDREILILHNNRLSLSVYDITDGERKWCPEGLFPGEIQTFAVLPNNEIAISDGKKVIIYGEPD